MRQGAAAHQGQQVQDDDFDDEYEHDELQGPDREYGRHRRRWAPYHLERPEREHHGPRHARAGRRRYWGGEHGQYDDVEDDADDEQEHEQAQAPAHQDQLFARFLEAMARTVGTNKPKKYNEAPKYDGETDYTIYQIQFDTVAEANDWNIQDRKTALIQALTGNATEVIANLKHQDVPITYESLDEALIRTFGRSASMWERKKDFNTLMQEKDQTDRQFSRQVERLGRAYLRNMKEQDIQEALVERFIKGLADKKAASRLAFAALPNLDEALKTLNRGLSLQVEEPPAKRVRLTKTEEKEEGEIEEKDEGKEEKTFKVNMVFPSEPTASTSRDVQTQKGRGRGRGSRGPRGGGRGSGRGGRGSWSGQSDNFDKDMVCHVCNRKGHRAANCWHKSKTRIEDIVCHTCGRKGHMARNCRSGAGSSKGSSGFAMPNVPPDLYKATMQWFLSQQNDAQPSTSKAKSPYVPKDKDKDQEN